MTNKLTFTLLAVQIALSLASPAAPILPEVEPQPDGQGRWHITFGSKSAAAPEVPEIPVAGPNENGRWHVTIGSGKSAVPVAPAEPEPLADAGSDGRWYVSIGSGSKSGLPVGPAEPQPLDGAAPDNNGRWHITFGSKHAPVPELPLEPQDA